MPIPRIVYFAQSATVKGATKTYTLPVSTASIEVSRPIEAVTAFGKFSSLNTAQTNLTTCKSTLKCYMGSGTNVSGVDASMLNDLIDMTKASSGIEVKVSPGGFTMTGVLTNIGLDISMGGFGMIDFGFAGVGNPIVSSPTSNQTTESAPTMAISPITTMSIGTGAALSGTYATSLKVSYDLPTDTLASLGDNPNADQGSPQLQSTIATKPPYKVNVSVEGHGVDPAMLDNKISNLAYNFGNISVTLPNAKISSRSFNNGAGQVSATYAYTAEDVAATFGSVALSAYTVDPDAQTLPAWGA